MFETWQDIVFQNAFFNLVITNEGFWICFELEVLKVQLTEFLKFEMTTSEYQFIHAGPDTDEIKFIYKQNNDKLLITVLVSRMFDLVQTIFVHVRIFARSVGEL